MNVLDKAISAIAPNWGVKRAAARLKINALSQTAGGSAYNGATAGRLGTQWFNIPNPAVTLGNQTTVGLEQTWQRARSLERNNPIAGAMLNRAVENLVGDGFGLQSTAVSGDSKKAAEWNKKAQGLTLDWLDSADVQGRGFYRQQMLWMKSHIRDGDMGLAMLSNARLQSFESDMIGTPYRNAGGDSPISGRRVFDGVEVNNVLRPTGYFVKGLDAQGKVSFSRYDAKDFILFGNEKRLSSQRGISYLESSFAMFDHVDDWVRSSIVAAKLAACFGIVITKNNAAAVTRGMETATNGAGKSQKIQDIEPGLIAYLQNGEDIKTLAPNQPTQSFPDQLRAMLRLLGIPMGLPLELILLDFSQTNFASAKASMLQAQRCFRMIQELFIEQVLSRLYRWRISKFIKEGQLEDRPDSWAHRWIPPAFPYLDQVKEMQAEMLMVDANRETLRQQHARRGSDFDQYLVERKAEVQSLRDGGIPLLRSNLSAQVIDKSSPAEASDQNAQSTLNNLQEQIAGGEDA